MSQKVSAAQGLSSEIQKMLKDYQDEVEEATDNILEKISKDCAKNLKSSSPVGKGPHGGRYAKGWAVTKEKGIKGAVKIGDYIVHNKTDYQLTHLLEYGHVGKNQYGTWGRVEAKEHIGEAERDAINACLKDLEDKL